MEAAEPPPPAAIPATARAGRGSGSARGGVEIVALRDTEAPSSRPPCCTAVEVAGRRHVVRRRRRHVVGRAGGGGTTIRSSIYLRIHLSIYLLNVVFLKHQHVVSVTWLWERCSHTNLARARPCSQYKPYPLAHRPQAAQDRTRTVPLFAPEWRLKPSSTHTQPSHAVTFLFGDHQHHRCASQANRAAIGVSASCTPQARTTSGTRT